jgi:hypothetical protein
MEKYLSVLRLSVLNTACERILEKVKRVIENKGNNNHIAYIELWELMRSEDDEIAMMFDDLKRSNAKIKLATWKRNGLISDEDLKSFSKETQDSINLINEIQR